MNFGSLVKADICLRVTNVHRVNIRDLVRNGTKFLMGISNVQTLHISVITHMVLTLCRESIPIFNNLSRLTVDTDQREGWESLPALLKNCPNLETLVFKGLYHKRTSNCQAGCLCKSSKEIPTCLSTSQVKVLIIKRFGENIHCTDDMKEQMDQVKHFMKSIPNLEKIRLDCGSTLDNMTELSDELQMLPKASPNCSIHVSSR